jgi:hypothetical protein
MLGNIFLMLLVKLVFVWWMKRKLCAKNIAYSFVKGKRKFELLLLKGCLGFVVANILFSSSFVIIIFKEGGSCGMFFLCCYKDFN